jgi:DNA-binding MarR family transcriptional regulator
MPAQDLVGDATDALLDGLAKVDRRLRQRPASGDLSQPEATTLARLAEGRPATVADLARAEGVRPQSMGATVRALEARGLVKRLRDRGDGRRVLLSVSSAGRAATGPRRSARGERVAAVLAQDFTDEELRTLRDAGVLLARLAERLS